MSEGRRPPRRSGGGTRGSGSGEGGSRGPRAHASQRPPRRVAQRPAPPSRAPRTDKGDDPAYGKGSGKPGSKGGDKADNKGERIAKLLARAGVGSRRDVERMIAEGRVAIDGRVLETPATILTTLDGVRVDGRPVASAQATRVFLFHKPSGVLTAARDPAGRPTIYDVLPAGLPRLVPVGRLDLNTEGLLLLTNDGELKRALELPANAVPRTYRVRAMGEVRQSDLEALAMGVTLDGVRYGPVDASVDRRARADGANIWLTMTLTEGKNREVRKLCEAMGLKVSRLIRTAYGPFQLADLPVRGVVEASVPSVTQLQRLLGRRSPPARS